MNYFAMILGILVWNKQLSLKKAKLIQDKLGDEIVPDTIEEVIAALKRASK